MSEEILQQFARQIASETLLAWEGFDRKGAAATVPHLASALHTCAQCGIRPGRLSFPELLYRQAFHPLPARRNSALRAIGLLGTTAGSPKMTALLLRRLRSSRWQTKRIVLETMHSLQIDNKQDGLFTLVVQELSNSHVPVRVAAARLLVFWEANEGSELIQTRMARLYAGKTQAHYLLRLAHDIAQAQETRENADVPLLAVGALPAARRSAR